MANFATLLQTIASNIYTNGRNEIDAADLKSVLNAMVEELGQAGYIFKGVAQASTNPGTPDTNVFYLAGVGTFTNFGGTTVDKGHIGVFAYNGSWSYQVLTTGAWFDSEVYPGEAALEMTFYDSDESDGVTIKINADVSNLGNSKLEAISAWWAARSERRLNLIQGYDLEFPTLGTSPNTLGAFKFIEPGQIISSITGASSLIFGTTDATTVTVDASALPYTATKTLQNVKLASGTATNVKIHVDGVPNGSVSVSQNTNTDSDGDGTIIIGGEEAGRYAGAGKLVKIVALTASQDSLNVGDVYYHTYYKQLRKKKATGAPSYDVIPYLNGAIYTYDNELYIWNGADLELVGSLYCGINSGLFEANKGKWLNNGELSEQPDYTTTDFIPIVEGFDIITWCFDGAAEYSNLGSICFYNANKEYISRYSSGESTLNHRKLIVGADQIPNGAKYFRISVSLAGLERAYILCGSEMLSLSASETVQYILNIKQDVTFTTESGGILTGNGGEWHPSSGYDNMICSDYIPVIPSKKYLISGKCASGVGAAGYNAEKSFNSNLWSTSSASVYQTEVANELEITIPANVFFIRICTMDNVTNPLVVKRLYDNIQEQIEEINNTVAKNSEDIKEIQESLEVRPPIIIKKTSSTRFSVWVLNRNSGKYIIHPFVHNSYSYDMSQYGGPSDLVCGDMWDVEDIKFENGNLFMAANLNFIYMVNPTASGEGFEHENLHVGMGGGAGGNHGCEVREWTRLLADGKEIDLDNWTGDIECSRFRLIQKSNCYAPDSSISSVNTNNYPKIVNGGPVVTAQHFLDATFEVDNHISWRNRLVIKRDHVIFEQLHGSMLACATPYFSDVIINDSKSSQNHFEIIEGTPTETVVGDSNQIWSNKYQADEAIYYGNGCCVRQRTTQDNGTKWNNTFISANAYQNSEIISFKCYFQVARTTSHGMTNPDVFNTGDEISVTNERKIEFLN